MWRSIAAGSRHVDLISRLKVPEWQVIIGREYETWDRPHIVVDTASQQPEDGVAELLARLSDPSELSD